MDEISSCGSVSSLFFWEHGSGDKNVFIENIWVAWVYPHSE